MTLKEHIIELVQSMSDDDDRLIVAERVLEPNGDGGTNGALEPVDDEEQIPTLEESIAILASVEFPPREEAWL
jgi:hypothetical protein